MIEREEREGERGEREGSERHYLVPLQMVAL
jgi:hypothetical protein